MYVLKPLVIPFVAVLLLVPIPAANAAETSGAHLQDLSKKKIEREKAFLLRSSDDLGRSLAYVGATMAVLNEQVEAEAVREPENTAKERIGLLAWYRIYADSLRELSAEFDLEVSDYFSRQPAAAGWIDRQEELTRNFRKLADELGGIMQVLENGQKKPVVRMQKLSMAVLERRVLITRDDRELARELWPAYRTDDRQEAIYKELTDAEVFYLRNELISLGEQRQYLESLSELGRYEQSWLAMKIEELSRLQELGRVIDNDEPVRIIPAVRNMIKTYENDRASIRRISGDIDARMHGITRIGTLRMLDRQEELSRYYENMKHRYERHGEWLGAQIGSYQADLIELGKEL